MAAPGLLQGAAITTACELKERIDLMKYEEIRDQLAAMTYRQREASKRATASESIPWKTGTT
jgi:hypothetical protein